LKLDRDTMLASMRLAAIAFLTTSLFASSYQVTPDIEYAAPGGESLKLDAHIPEGRGPFPAIILVHGGGWTAGHKTVNFVKDLFPVLDQTGMALFTIDYRLAPKHLYPAARVDVEAAVQWVKANAKQYKVNPRKIALMGESAGGHLVNLVGVNNDVGVAAVVCFYAPIDMGVFSKKFSDKPATGSMKSFFLVNDWGPADTAKLHEASPHTYLNKKTPPFLIIHEERGIPVELITVQEGVHGVTNWEKHPRFHGYKQPMID
jgi:alpha-L-fucosidase 2